MILLNPTPRVRTSIVCFAQKNSAAFHTGFIFVRHTLVPQNSNESNGAGFFFLHESEDSSETFVSENGNNVDARLMYESDFYTSECGTFSRGARHEQRRRVGLERAEARRESPPHHHVDERRVGAHDAPWWAAAAAHPDPSAHRRPQRLHQRRHR